jgi:hypothetical protein
VADPVDRSTRTLSPDTSQAGDRIPANFSPIEVRVAELRQLFNAIDPSPFGERDLDPKAEEFIVDWARQMPRESGLCLVVHLERPAGLADEAGLLGDAVRSYFAGRAAATRRRLRHLFRVGRVSLVIGLLALAASFGLAELVTQWTEPTGFMLVVRESLLIGGWVAMWRPLEVFLYDWWPIRAEARLFDRLALMPVQIRYESIGPRDGWRQDWPAAPMAGEPAVLSPLRNSIPSENT